MGENGSKRETTSEQNNNIEEHENSYLDSKNAIEDLNKEFKTVTNVDHKDSTATGTKNKIPKNVPVNTIETTEDFKVLDNAEVPKNEEPSRIRTHRPFLLERTSRNHWQGTSLSSRPVKPIRANLHPTRTRLMRRSRTPNVTHETNRRCHNCHSTVAKNMTYKSYTKVTHLKDASCQTTFWDSVGTEPFVQGGAGKSLAAENDEFVAEMIEFERSRLGHGVDTFDIRYIFYYVVIYSM